MTTSLAPHSRRLRRSGRRRRDGRTGQWRPSPARGKPTALSMFAKTGAANHAAALAADEEGDGDHGVDADEAESVKLRGEFEQSITAAPGRGGARPPVWSRRRQAGAALPVAGGSWDEVTDKPFLNDPVDRGANFGVGWGDVTGRMTALTHSGSTVYAAAASGGVWRSHEQRQDLEPRSNAGLPRLSVGALATDPAGRLGLGRHRRGQQRVREPVRRRRLPAGQGLEHLAAGRRLRAVRLRHLPHRLDQRATSTSRPATACTGVRSVRPRSSPWQLVLAPAGVKDYPPSSSVTDVIAVPGTNGAQGPRRGRLGRLQRPAGDRQATASTSAPAASGSFTRITPTGDINPKRRSGGRRSARPTAGCTRSSRTPRPTTCAARASSCPSRATRPGRGR